MFRFLTAALLVMLAAVPALTRPALAEDGYDLWLRYRPMEADAQAQYRRLATVVVSPKATSPSLDVATAEIARGLSGLLNQAVGRGSLADGAVVIGTPESSAFIGGLNLPLAGLGKEGYLIRS